MNLSDLRDQFDAIRKEVGLFNGSAFIEEGVEQFNKLATDVRTPVDIVLSSACRALISPGGLPSFSQLDLFLVSESCQLGCSVGLRRAMFGVFICVEEEISALLPQQDAWRFFCSQGREYLKCRLVIIGDQGKKEHDLAALGVATNVIIEIVHIPSAADLSSALLGVDDPKMAGQVALHKLMSAGPVVDRLKSIIANEVSTLTLRRQIIVSEQERSRRTDQGAGSEAQSIVRNALQKNFQDTDRIFRQKYEELCRPNVGALAKLIEAHADSLTADQIIKVDKAANFEKYETKIDSRYLDDCVSKLKLVFNQEMKNDAVYIKQLAQDVESSVAAALGKMGLPPETLDNVVRPQLDLEKLDQSHFHIARAYKGELTKPGDMEYFGALRDYTGLIMVIVGILAPLTMLATAPDADKGSLLEFINVFSGSLKEVRAYIQFLTIILIFGMLAYGIFDLRRRIPNKRRQELEKEVLEAREFIFEQMSRLLNDAHRDWTAVLGQYVKDYSQALQTEFDSLLKRQASSLQEVVAKKRSAAQLEQVSVEHKIKSFAAVERTVENLVRRYQDVVDRLNTSLASRSGASTSPSR